MFGGGDAVYVWRQEAGCWVTSLTISVGSSLPSYYFLKHYRKSARVLEITRQVRHSNSPQGTLSLVVGERHINKSMQQNITMCGLIVAVEICTIKWEHKGRVVNWGAGWC